MEQKASVENFHVPLETLQTIVGEFGFTLVTQQLLTGGFSSCNFRCSLKVRSDTALPVRRDPHAVHRVAHSRLPRNLLVSASMLLPMPPHAALCIISSGLFL